ncbi:hypothetical protein [Streptomyces sp. NBC_00448]|uniref:hypothetical protein n=1 Tax=Streptomyces sp. NBC_00448 TaxID=2903652 RepID=UPI002E21EFC6
MTQPAAREVLTAQVATAVREVPGIAFLKPSLSGLLRASIRSTTQGASRQSTEGVRLTSGEGRPSWTVSVHVVARRGHRALDVARAIREAATAALAVTSVNGQSPPPVTVSGTISGIV